MIRELSGKDSGHQAMSHPVSLVENQTWEINNNARYIYIYIYIYIYTWHCY